MPEIIYESDYTPPAVLPRSSLFRYLFPDTPGESPLPPFDPALPAYIDGLDGRVLSRGELEDGALRLASGLASLGLKRGDVACLWGMNSLEWIRAAFGCMAAGLCVSPANYAYSPSEIAHQVNDSGAQVIFIDPAVLPQLELARKLFKREFPASRVVLLTTPEKKTPELGQFKTVTEVFGARGRAAKFTGDEVFDTAWLCYSSGTTGLPKGVMTTNYNMTSQLQALNVGYQKLQSGKDVVLGVLPFSHIYGLTIVLMQPCTVGVPLVVLPRFEEISVLSAIQKHKITHGLIVPPVLIVLLHSQNVPKYDLTSLKTLMTGAAPCSSELTDAFMKRLPWIRLTQGYGMTECSPTTHTFVGDEAEGRAGWTGRLLPTFTARLVTEDGTDAAAGERGELWLAGPSVMKGYHNNPEATAKTMEGKWYKTGDVLVRDDQGWYKVVDRVKELIKYKGFQVPPAELEALLLTHPEVVDSGVIGVWDESQATELPRAYIVAAPGVNKAGLGAKVARWVQERVAPHKRLRGGVVVIDVVPKSPSGKILRKDLRVRAEAERKAEGVVAKL